VEQGYICAIQKPLLSRPCEREIALAGHNFIEAAAGDKGKGSRSKKGNKPAENKDG
jgi:hypothetical protein